MEAFTVAFRNLYRARGFAALVILTLALGIGATTAMFSVVDAVLINPLPFANAHRIVEVLIYFQEDAVRTPAATGAVMAALRNEPGLFDAVGAYQFGAGTLTDAGEPETISVAGMSPAIFTIFPVAPLHGRLFRAADATSSDRVVLISERLWTAHFGRDPGIVDRAVVIDDTAYRVVGILPARFNFPESSVGAWRPIDVDGAGVRARVPVVGVLRDGVTRAQVDDRLKALSTALQESGALPGGQSLVADIPLQIRYGRRVATSLYLLLGAVGVLLLVACVNISNLMLVRASVRRGELAIMSALGAGTSRMLRDAGAESLWLGITGGALGLWLAGMFLNVILALVPENFLMLSSATGTLDLRAVAFALAVTSTTCVGFSILPAWRVSRLDAVDALKHRAHAMSAPRDDWWQGALVSMQLALVVVLLAGAGLLLRSYVALNGVDLGFDPSGLVIVDIQMPARYAKGGASRAFMRDVESRVEAALGIPASVSMPPLGFTVEDDARPEVEGQAAANDPIPLPWSFGRVSGDFFDVVGIPIIAGRTFRPDDDERSVIVNDVFVRRYFGSRSPIGLRFRSEPRQPWLTVIGVAADIKMRGPVDVIGEGAELYFPMVPGDSRYLSLLMRAGRNEAAVQGQVRQIIGSLDPKLPISTQTMTERIGDAIERPRFVLSLSGVFTICAVVIAAVGVYGVSAYWVTRRRREMAIRMAMGASPHRLVIAALARSLRLAAIGAFAGLVIALGGAQVMKSLLFGVDARDPVTFVGVTIFLGVIAIVACLGPALKASRVDPMTTLRAE